MLIPLLSFSQETEDSLYNDTIPVGEIILNTVIINDYEVVSPNLLDTIFVNTQMQTGDLTDNNIGDVFSIDIVLTNPNVSPVKYADYQKDCSCLILNLPNNQINPGGSITIPIKLEIMKPKFTSTITLFGYDVNNKYLYQIQPIKFIVP